MYVCMYVCMLLNHEALCFLYFNHMTDCNMQYGILYEEQLQVAAQVFSILPVCYDFVYATYAPRCDTRL